MFMSFDLPAEGLYASRHPTASGLDGLLDHWAGQFRDHLTQQWLKVVVERTPASPAPGGGPLRHGITIKRDHDDKVLMTGIIRSSDADDEAIHVAAEAARYEYLAYIDISDALRIPPVEIGVFFLSGVWGACRSVWENRSWWSTCSGPLFDAQPLHSGHFQAV